MHLQNHYDVIVVGGGHAGTEAAWASARMGAKTLLLTQNIETIGQMSCNPAIGGIGKGHLVKEIDALDGVMAQAADLAGIHFRILNRRKGPAVQATRAQADRVLYKQAIRFFLEKVPHLRIFQQSVEDLIVQGDQVQGVVTQMGLRIFAPTVILTVGTFLGGKIHVGEVNFQGGRAGDPPSNALSKRLRELPFQVGRLKTGTPPRIDSKTIDFSQLQVQAGDEPTPIFSFLGKQEDHPSQTLCYITHTTEATHDLIRQSLKRSPLYSGTIVGVGPRYCPSIEDKVVRWHEKSSHQIFVEPEGLHTAEVYPNGISTSLPFDVQLAFVQTIKGFEKAHLTRPGYAIEYDFCDPRGLYHSLETRCIKGLFFAGQINGTTGYEEAAAQGIIAGVNAALRVQGQEPWWPKRYEAYVGVLIDDLVTLGTREPYRMFTSRAEYRLLLREDNADLRLTSKGRELGVVNEIRWQAFQNKLETLEREKERLKSLWINPHTQTAQKLEPILKTLVTSGLTAWECLKRPQVGYDNLAMVEELGPFVREPIIGEELSIQSQYEGYIKRQGEEISQRRTQEDKKLPVPFDYEKVKGLSHEVRQKLVAVQPRTIGQAARIPGVTPAAISLLLIHLKRC
ncbi:MAG: tRNA uridine-5-carboxymethylaminomethyl(34) synthesis enzyme MnmG [Gammaproteobacteria bacterium]|nr:tRNA uridine-5-carboxymethylaminomethyl(34) synthesis enzyme MnmG [Gammaproteobacteria bacterium]